ncbi:hypothetical protein OBJ96_08995 [Empedobacter falsenii]
MSNLSVQIALDFVECTKEQKEIFLKHLEVLNWHPVNPDKLWIAELKKGESNQTQLNKIERELILAKEISNLYELDYAIIIENEIYFNQLN